MIWSRPGLCINLHSLLDDHGVGHVGASPIGEINEAGSVGSVPALLIHHDGGLLGRRTLLLAKLSLQLLFATIGVSLPFTFSMLHRSRTQASEQQALQVVTAR
jgi:hypothetical protein